MKRVGLIIAALLVLVATAGCGGASYQGVAAAMAPAEMEASGGSYAAPARGPAAAGGEQYAQNEPPPREGTEAVATDATAPIPLLIYTAELGLAVHQVTEKQDRVEAIAREQGGFLASRTDDTIVIRVPSRVFEAVMAQIQALGDILTRRIDVQDVTEEFHDVQTRIQTLEAMRQRVEQLLRDARDVQGALAIEQHLERITVELERLRGRLRFLSDRVAFSTLTVRFQERTDTREPDFRLPFPWLDGLGLQHLLQL